MSNLETTISFKVLEWYKQSSNVLTTTNTFEEAVENIQRWARINHNPEFTYSIEQYEMRLTAEYQYDEWGKEISH
jgi:hypothetical protein